MILRFKAKILTKTNQKAKMPIKSKDMKTASFLKSLNEYLTRKDWNFGLNVFQWGKNSRTKKSKFLRKRSLHFPISYLQSKAFHRVMGE